VSYVKSILGFVLGGLAVVAVFMALEVYVAGNTYRGTPPFGNLVLGVVLVSPYVVCGSLGFALGLKLFGTIIGTFRALLMGAGFSVAVGLLVWGSNRIAQINPFEYSMVSGVVVVFVLAIPFALLARALMRSNVEVPAS